MKKTSKEDRNYLWSSLLCLIPILIGLLIYNQLPEQMPIHWNINGEIDGYASKNFAIIYLPLFLFLIDLFTKFMIVNDPKRAGHPKKMLNVLKYMIPFLSMSITILMIAEGRGYQINFVNLFFECLVGIIFLLIGNYLPKVRQNHVMGIKLPWTLSDEDNWNKTNRLGGYIFMSAGLVMLIIPFLNLSSNVTGVIIVACIFAVVIIPSVYSYSLYKKKQ